MNLRDQKRAAFRYMIARFNDEFDDEEEEEGELV